VAAGGQSPVTLKVQPSFLKVVDALAQRRGLNRSEFLRELVKEECLRMAADERAKERDGD
jgi:metal-responsive CopG/Arc/MetJ family transcriptional regulator